MTFKICDILKENKINAGSVNTTKGLRSNLQGASVTLHTILLGVGGTIYNNHTLEPLQELGLDSQRVKKLASKLHVHSVKYAARQIVHTRRALSETIITSH